jgi:hypothetical protein
MSDKKRPRYTPCEKEYYPRILKAFLGEGVPFVVIGGHAQDYWTCRYPYPRKDLDLGIMPADRQRAVEILTECGFADYEVIKPYDRSWIYRSFKTSSEGDLIIDLIWQQPNGVGPVDASWFTNRSLHHAQFCGIPRVPFTGTAELLWLRLYIAQMDRLSWPELCNFIRALEGQIDWDRLLELIDQDWPLLEVFIRFYDLFFHEERHYIPTRLRGELASRDQQGRPCLSPHLIDTRPWWIID